MTEESAYERTRQRLHWQSNQANLRFKCRKYGITITGCHMLGYMYPQLDECENQCGVKPDPIKAPKKQRKNKNTPKRVTTRKIVRKPIRTREQRVGLTKKGVLKHVRRNSRNTTK